MMAAVFGANAARAANDSWINPAGGSWNDNANWGLNAPPTTANDVSFFLNSTSGYTVTLNDTANCKNLSFFRDNLTLALNGFDLHTIDSISGHGMITFAAPTSGAETSMVTLLGTSGTETIHSAAGIQVGEGVTQVAIVTVNHSILSADEGGNVFIQTGSILSVTNGGMIQTSGPGTLTNAAGGTVKLLSGGRASVAGYSQVAGSHLNIGLGGAAALDCGKLIDNAAATFAGTLDVTLQNSFAPTANQSFDLFDFTSETGSFATINLPAVGAGGSWDLSNLYTTGVIKLTALMSGDANLDGTVDVGDLGALATNYGTTSGATWAQGDFDNNGGVNVGDLGVLATNYGKTVGGGGGIANVASVAAVPEPGAGMLLGSAAVAMIWRRSARRSGRFSRRDV
jgi:hypothetical protein